MFDTESSGTDTKNPIRRSQTIKKEQSKMQFCNILIKDIYCTMCVVHYIKKKSKSYRGISTFGSGKFVTPLVGKN